MMVTSERSILSIWLSYDSVLDAIIIGLYASLRSIRSLRSSKGRKFMSSMELLLDHAHHSVQV